VRYDLVPWAKNERGFDDASATCYRFQLTVANTRVVVISSPQFSDKFRLCMMSIDSRTMGFRSVSKTCRPFRRFDCLRKKVLAPGRLGTSHLHSKYTVRLGQFKGMIGRFDDGTVHRKLQGPGIHSPRTMIGTGQNGAHSPDPIQAPGSTFRSSDPTFSYSADGLLMRLRGPRAL
jgi:hypothetical protein